MPATSLITAGGDMTGELPSRSFFESIMDAFRDGEVPTTVVLDLRRVTKVDTKLVAILVEAHRVARQRRVTLEVWPSPSLLDVLTVCRLDQLVRTSTAEHRTRSAASESVKTIEVSGHVASLG